MIPWQIYRSAKKKKESLSLGHWNIYYMLCNAGPLIRAQRLWHEDVLQLHTHQESLSMLSGGGAWPWLWLWLWICCLSAWGTWNRTLSHPGSQNTFVLHVLPHKKNEIVWSIYAKWNVQSNMLLSTWNVLQVCPATWELPKYGEL